MSSPPPPPSVFPGDVTMVMHRVALKWFSTYVAKSEMFYPREDLLEVHKPYCKGIDQTAVQADLSEIGKNKLTFQNYYKQLPVPYIIYADFEALTTKIEGPQLDPTKSNTRKTNHYKVCSYSYILV